MPVRRTAAIALLAAAAACAPGPARTPGTPGVRLPGTLVVSAGGTRATVDLEEYVLGSILAEISPVGESDATIARVFEVHAVLARTYAATHLGRHRAEGFDLCDATHCQRYDPGRISRSRFSAAARAAVERTRRLMVLYGGRPAETLYHADCGGETAAAEDVWGGRVPYLVPIADEVPAMRHRTWQRTIARRDLAAALNADPRTKLAGELVALSIDAQDASGRAARLTIADDRGTTRTTTGEIFRTIVNRSLASPGLQSTRFAIANRGAVFVFDGSGFGHGVGLCQVGALARARRGDTLEAILGAYYPDIRIGR
ncbi:MAG TPA: SpoIID/LytB domain-containing protein [Vicinamibacterales bacterium]|nr:SpoIID/LytB domain-containing protein [Vicinamibacterales bacterium]